MQLVFKTEEKSADLRTALNYEHTYDLVILGAGPAGLTAALYALRKKLDTALISKDIGGQLLSTWDLENYMGFRKIEGFGLTKKFEEQVSQFPLAFAEGYSLTSLSKTSDSIFEATLDNGQTVRSRSIILATGKKWRPLGVPGEEEYTGKGVAYCATCDAPLYKNKKVIVAGGGNSGVEAALELSRIASEVHLVELTDKLLCDEILKDKLKEAANVRVLLAHRIKEIKGEQFLTAVVMEDLAGGTEKTLELDGVFVEIGLIPNTDFKTSPGIKLNEYKEIVIDDRARTNIDGVFAAGDVTSVPEKQVIIAAGEGAKAALSAFKYLQYK